MAMQDLPQSASKQQEQQEDREPMPVAVIHELAQRLYNLDESSTNGTFLLTARLMHHIPLGLRQLCFKLRSGRYCQTRR